MPSSAQVGMAASHVSEWRHGVGAELIGADFQETAVRVYLSADSHTFSLSRSAQGCQVGLFEAKYDKFGLFLNSWNLLSIWPFFQV